MKTMLFGFAIIGGLAALMLWLAMREPGQDRRWP